MKMHDKNLLYKEINTEGLEFFDYKNADKFSVFGFCDFYNTERPLRMPDDIAKAVNVGVDGANPLNAGGRICFKTNSTKVSIIAKVSAYHGPNFTGIALAGFDLNVKENGKFHRRYIFRPKYDISLPYAGLATLAEGEKELLIHMPNYGAVESLEIGVEKGCYVEPLNPYNQDIKPILYYGSSITQGGSASVPGNAYENIIGVRTNVDFINLGFSGWAKGETIMAEYIANQEISLFVYDYDHNASLEHYRDTHYAFYKTIRNAKPDLPILVVTRPDVEQVPSETDLRIEIALETVERAKAEGDKNIYFINGYDLFGPEDVDLCTVDGCHPNDLGFYRMANVIGAKIKEILKLK